MQHGLESYGPRSIDSGCMNDQPYKIPKLTVPVVLHVVPASEIQGDIFLDFSSSQGTSVQHVLEYFNTDSPFFPLRTDSGSVLVSKHSILWIEVPLLLKEFQEETSVKLAERREVLIQTDEIEEIKATIVLDLPEAYGRTLDLLNKKENFIVMIRSETLMILNLHHVTKIQELL
jgi:hypothetical protein